MEPESKVSSCHSYGEWLFFLKMLGGKGRTWLILVAPGPCSTQVAMEGTEPPALGTQPPVIPCHQNPVQQYEVSVTNCSGCGMGPKPWSLVSQCCGVMLLSRDPCKPCSCPGQKNPKEEQAPPLPPGKVSSTGKGVRKNWQTGRWRERKETVWGCCQRAAPSTVRCSHLILHPCLTSVDTLDDTLVPQFTPL